MQTLQSLLDQSSYPFPIAQAAELFQRVALYLTKPDLVVLVFLLSESYRQDSNEVSVSTYQVAEITALSRLTVAGSLRRLTTLGMIQFKSHYGPSPSTYQIDLVGMEAHAARENAKLMSLFENLKNPPVRKRTRQG